MPYRAAASGPFSTTMLSMSSGLMSAARLVKSTPRLLNAVSDPGASEASEPVLSVLLSIGRPSMIMSGWLLPLIELTPRMVIDEEAPGTPDVLVTSTPATRPCRPLMKFSRPVAATSAPETVCCEVPRLRWVVVWPRAVTTTASRFAADLVSCTLMASAVPTVRSCGT